MNFWNFKFIFRFANKGFGMDSERSGGRDVVLEEREDDLCAQVHVLRAGVHDGEDEVLAFFCFFFSFRVHLAFFWLTSWTVKRALERSFSPQSPLEPYQKIWRHGGDHDHAGTLALVCHETLGP